MEVEDRIRKQIPLQREEPVKKRRRVKPGQEPHLKQAEGLLLYELHGR